MTLTLQSTDAEKTSSRTLQITSFKSKTKPHPCHGNLDHISVISSFFCLFCFCFFGFIFFGWFSRFESCGFHRIFSHRILEYSPTRQVPTLCAPPYCPRLHPEIRQHLPTLRISFEALPQIHPVPKYTIFSALIFISL